MCSNMAEDIDNDLLISLIRENPPLWDKNAEGYKSSTLTREIWESVCRQLNPLYDEMDNNGQTLYYKTVWKRWANLRDAWIKSVKRFNDCVKTRKKIRRYIYHDQMKFLYKIFDPAECPDDTTYCDTVIKSEEHELPVIDHVGELHHIDQFTIQESSPNISRGRKRSYPDEETSNSMETPGLNPHLCFFQGILPHLRKYNENETLEFQIGVLQLISRINDKKQTIQPP